MVSHWLQVVGSYWGIWNSFLSRHVRRDEWSMCETSLFMASRLHLKSGILYSFLQYMSSWLMQELFRELPICLHISGRWFNILLISKLYCIVIRWYGYNISTCWTKYKIIFKCQVPYVGIICIIQILSWSLLIDLVKTVVFVYS